MYSTETKMWINDKKTYAYTNAHLKLYHLVANFSLNHAGLVKTGI